MEQGCRWHGWGPAEEVADERVPRHKDGGGRCLLVALVGRRRRGRGDRRTVLSAVEAESDVGLGVRVEAVVDHVQGFSYEGGKRVGLGRGERVDVSRDRVWVEHNKA